MSYRSTRKFFGVREATWLLGLGALVEAQPVGLGMQKSLVSSHQVRFSSLFNEVDFL